jgi:hypothetical protein
MEIYGKGIDLKDLKVDYMSIYLANKDTIKKFLADADDVYAQGIDTYVKFNGHGVPQKGVIYIQTETVIFKKLDEEVFLVVEIPYTSVEEMKKIL